MYDDDDVLREISLQQRGRHQIISWEPIYTQSQTQHKLFARAGYESFQNDDDNVLSRTGRTNTWDVLLVQFFFLHFSVHFALTWSIALQSGYALFVRAMYVGDYLGESGKSVENGMKMNM